jgi:hypothetical protein
MFFLHVNQAHSNYRFTHISFLFFTDSETLPSISAKLSALAIPHALMALPLAAPSQSTNHTVEPRSRRAPMSIIDTFKQVVHDFELEIPQSFSVIEVAKKCDIPVRRAYDFFNLLISVGVCSLVEKGTLRWVGVKEVMRTFKEVYAQLEVLDLTLNFKLLFNTGSSPPLGILGLRFVCLFLYLGVETLSIKRAIRLFQSPNINVKSLKRRLCLALNFLNALGTIVHTSKTSEYQLTIDRQEIVDYAMARKKQFSNQSSLHSMECLLSRYDTTFLKQMYRKREEQYAAMFI